MTEQIIEVLVDGGAASAGPPLGPALGPVGVNVGEVVAEINKKTADYKGMKVPVKVIVDTTTKEFNIKVGSPSVSSLVKEELNLEKGSAKPRTEIIADMSIDRTIKLARMKQEGMLSPDLKSATKEILGTCMSMGVSVEGKRANETQKDVDAGVYDDKISGKVALTFESKEELEAKKAALQAEIAEAEKEAALFDKLIKLEADAGKLTDADVEDRKAELEKMDDCEIKAMISQLEKAAAPAAEGAEAAKAGEEEEEKKEEKPAEKKEEEKKE
jgi:large subunit ribosomal protein L11